MNEEYDLDSIAFDTFGWTLIVSRLDSRVYKAADMYLAVDFYERPPRIQLASADDLRAQLTDALGDDSELVDVAVYSYRSATITMATIRSVQGMHPIYFSSVHILFANRFWVLRVEIIDDEHHNERELAALDSTLALSDDITALEESPPLYSRYFDGLVPLDQDPVARIRKLTDALARSIDLPDAVLAQEPYRPITQF